MKAWVVIAILLSWGCTKVQMDDCFTSAGSETTETRQLDIFTQIVTTDKIQVVLVQDSLKDGMVILEGPENLLSQIETEVSDGILNLDNRNSCNFVRSFENRIVIRAHFKDLKSLMVKSASEVTTEGTIKLSKLNILHEALSDCSLKLDVTDEVYVQSYNSAYLKLEGKAKVLKGSIEGVSDLDARDLLAEQVILDNHSPLDCYINASEIIFVKIFNDGNIYYVSEPSNYKDLNYRRGIGDLIKLP
ncbi:MAG: DUF2807 domain-containing protein [Bacteroidia bacterium]